MGHLTSKITLNPAGFFTHSDNYSDNSSWKYKQL